MAKDDQVIMVVKRSVLFADRYFNGFCPANEYNYESIILENLFYEKRGLAEETPSLKQPVGYCLIVNPEMKKVFVYQRSDKDEDYGEKRLQGRWSWGIGGHMEKVDEANNNPIEASMVRELTEEVQVNGDMQFQILGYINDDHTRVGEVHFGILYLVTTTATSIQVLDKEVAYGSFVDLARVDEILKSPGCEVESWSEIAAGPLRIVLGQ